MMSYKYYKMDFIFVWLFYMFYLFDVANLFILVMISADNEADTGLFLSSIRNFGSF